MKKLINHLKTFLFFPIYTRKNNIINLEILARINNLDRELQSKSTETNTLISLLLSNDYGLNKTRRQKELIVSLTTHSHRIEKVGLAIQSIMDQTLKADKIVLSINKEKFNNENIPNTLKLLENRGLTINYCKDIGPYTKLVPVLKIHPESIIVTVDDDLIYPRNLLETLYKAYEIEPNFIHCLRMHYMKFASSGEIKPYSEWDLCSGTTKADNYVFPTGVGGVLYPPHSFNDEVFNEDAFMKLSPNADDVWFKAMSLLNNVLCKKVDSDIMNNPVVISGTEFSGLKHENLYNNANDVKIDQVFSTYELWEKFKT